jgi:hypothetical protein
MNGSDFPGWFYLVGAGVPALLTVLIATTVSENHALALLVAVPVGVAFGVALMVGLDRLRKRHR